MDDTSQSDAKNLIGKFALHPECDPLVTRAPKFTREQLETAIKRWREERATWGIKDA